jgi:hypothetical protein
MRKKPPFPGLATTTFIFEDKPITPSMPEMSPWTCARLIKILKKHGMPWRHLIKK